MSFKNWNWPKICIKLSKGKVNQKLIDFVELEWFSVKKGIKLISLATSRMHF